jgi:hypothetical protein
MRAVLPTAVLILAAWLHLEALARGAGVKDPSEKRVFHVQYIVCSDQDHPPKQSRPVAPDLAARLRPTYRWKYMWEVKRVSVSLPKDGPARVPLSSDVSIQIESTGAHRSEVRLYRASQLTRKTSRKDSDAVTWMGGDAANGAWYVVVRNDAPSD